MVFGFSSQVSLGIYYYIPMSSLMDIFTFYFLVATFLYSQTITLISGSTPPIISSRINIVGAVYCDTCLDKGFTKYSWFMSGVDVHIECKLDAESSATAEIIMFSGNRSTDNKGVYKVEIASVDGIDCINGSPIQFLCQATLIRSSFKACNVPALIATTDITSTKSKQKNTCTYTFSPLSFRPSHKNQTLCGKEC